MHNLPKEHHHLLHKLEIYFLPLQSFAKASTPHFLFRFTLSGCSLTTRHDILFIIPRYLSYDDVLK